MSVPASLLQLAGNWTGLNRLWLSPSEPVCISDTTATLTLTAQGRFLAIRYTWADEGQRAHLATAESYAELKRCLAQDLADPLTYPDVKDPAVDMIYLAAEEWAAATHWQPGPSDV